MAEDAKGSLTHIDKDGRPRMVDVSTKPDTARTASASGFVTMSKEALEIVKNGTGKKGNAAAFAELAGVMGAKKTSDLIPLCHPLSLSSAKVTAEVDEKLGGVRISAIAKTTGPTGVEMEALTAVNVTALTVYDMSKAVDKTMEITGIRVVLKDGGKSGRFEAK